MSTADEPTRSEQVQAEEAAARRWPTLAEARKGAVAVGGFVVLALTIALGQGDLIPEAGERWAVFVVALGTAVGVYQVPNSGASRS